jgi:hypothetical protein
MNYEEARIEALEHELKSVSKFIGFIIEHYPKAYVDATMNHNITISSYITEGKIDTE